MSDQTSNSGFELDDFETSIRPQDDLYLHVNSRWFERTEIPSDKARYGTFDVLADAAELAIREILDESRTADAGSEARKVGDLYTSFLDEER
ncbi:MAG: peptidase M13, partial [Acidimicrobiales bacterium]